MNTVFDFIGTSPFDMNNASNLNVGKYKPMGDDVRDLLIEHFKPHNERLYKMLGRSFEWDK